MKKLVDKFDIVNIISLLLFTILSLGLIKNVIPGYFSVYYNIARVAVWICIAIVVAQYNKKIIIYRNKDRIHTVLLVVFLAYVFCYILGTFVGFVDNPVSSSFKLVMRNLFTLGIIALIIEFIRTKYIEIKGSTKSLVMLTFLMILSEIDFGALGSVLDNWEELFKFFVKYIIPVISKQILCTYLSKNGGLKLNYAYTIPVTLANYVLPVFPDLDWFVMAMSNLIVTLIIISRIEYSKRIDEEKLTKRERRNSEYRSGIVTTLVLIIFVMFVGGVFPFKPLAIMSNSMLPTFARGAVVVSKKVNSNYGQIDVGDILEFKTANGVVVHRVIDVVVDEKGKYTFKTQGDANNSPDDIEIKEEQVVGVVKIWIPYIGYPSVWMAELLFNQKSYIKIE